MNKQKIHSGFVYVVRNPYEKRAVVRLGWSSDLPTRLNKHASAGYSSVLVVVRATEAEERLLHRLLLKHKIKIDIGTSYSHYDYNGLHSWIEWLINRHSLGFESISQCNKLSDISWDQWSPEAMGKYNPIPPGRFFPPVFPKCMPSDEYGTPKYIVDLLREAVGGCFDLDPASNAEANKVIKAAKFFTKNQNGLTYPWHGTIFLNPPYGAGKEKSEYKATLAELFMKKNIEEIKARRVKQTVAILNSQSIVTKWWPCLVGRYADKNILWRRRINFIGAIAKSSIDSGRHTPGFSSAKNGTIISYFGPYPDRFLKVLRPWAAFAGTDDGAVTLFPKETQ